MYLCLPSAPRLFSAFRFFKALGSRMFQTYPTTEQIHDKDSPMSWTFFIIIQKR